MCLAVPALIASISDSDGTGFGWLLQLEREDN